MDKVSIAEARQNLPSLVHQVEHTGPLQLTRRGHAVAVLLSQEEYERLSSRKPDLWEAIVAFREGNDLDLEPLEDSHFEGLRDSSSAREFEWPE
jgi:antitoxin Phd